VAPVERESTPTVPTVYTEPERSCYFPREVVWSRTAGSAALAASDTTRWSSRLSMPRISEGFVTKLAPHKIVKLIAQGKLTFDERITPPCGEGAFAPQWRVLSAKARRLCRRKTQTRSGKSSRTPLRRNLSLEMPARMFR